MSSPKYIEDGFNEKQKRSVIHKGDFLINIVGASMVELHSSIWIVRQI